MPPRLAPLLVLLSFMLAVPASRAGPIELPSPMLDLSPFLLWDATFTVRAGGGQKDNPTYAPTFREPAGFMALGADMLLLRLPTDGNSFYLFFTGDDDRYFGAPSVRKEQVFATQAQFKHEWTDWSVSLTGQHLYADQVFDLSEEGSGTNAPTRGHIQAKGHTLTGKSAVRRSWGSGWWLEGELSASRQYFGAPLDGYSEPAARVALGLTYGHRSSVELAIAGALRTYDDSALIAADGTLLPGTREELATRTVDLIWRHRWDRSQHWRTVLRGSARRTEDNGQGYFDYDKLYASAQVQFESGRWLAKLTGRFSRFSYAVQQADAAGNGPRERDEFSGEARLEYQLRPKLKLIGAFELERSLANSAFDAYTARTVSAGLEWEL